MRRLILPLVGLACPLVLVLVCFRAVLFQDEQFAYRDAGYFYYPLYQRVQQQWQSGLVPLWEPGLNAGTPLLGTPMAAVLYPGKLIYATLPYAWAARAYVIAHTILALLGAMALGRSLGVGRIGALLGGLGYAFGAPVLFQYCNVIYLVGAAWAPWGLRGADRLLRRGLRTGGCELSAALALQVLGGDVESAYLTAACGAGYAVVLAAGSRGRPLRLPGWRPVLGAVVVWVAGVLGLAYARPGAGWSSAVGALVLAGWLIVGVAIVRHWRRRPGEARLGPMLAGLVVSCVVTAALVGAQLLPILEFAARSGRVVGEEVTNLYRFSLEPYRLVELAWPNVFGTTCPENRSWIQAIPPVGERQIWVDSLYMGGLALVLALGAAGWRGSPPWRAWMTAILVVALAASLGKFAGPLWWARWSPSAAALGTHDPFIGTPREDNSLADGTGSPYGLLATLLPGFGVFRYPAKLLTFAAMALAVLAGDGWDRLMAGEAARVRRLSRIGLAASLLGLVFALAARGRVVALLSGRALIDRGYGPADVAGAWAETQRALAHGAVVFAACLALARWAPRRPRLSGALALVLMTADLSAANARLVWTAPQAVFEETPEAARSIEEAERAEPSPGPFRVHRLPDWFPARFIEGGSADRFRQMVAWERGTLAPMYALPLGLEYCSALGYLELDDYMYFFRPRMTPVPASMARVLGVPAGQTVFYIPRRSFDLWGARYFVLPASADRTASLEVGFDPFLPGTDAISPSTGPTRGGGGRVGRDPEDMRRDWQLRRNRAAFPRAWVVHDAHVRSVALNPADRSELMKTLVFRSDPTWVEPGQPVTDLRSTTWIEAVDPANPRFRQYIDGGPVDPSETATVVKHEPQRVELKATLRRPGLVILADTYYPGWRLTIDGVPAPIFRANRLMRGAAVPAGEHTLVYTYRPQSFLLGAIVSATGLVVLIALVVRSRRDRLVRRGPGG